MINKFAKILGLVMIMLTFCITVNTYAAEPFGSYVGAFDSVPAYSNLNPTNYSNEFNYVDGVYIGVKWQCVEYVRRYYWLKYGLDLASLHRGNANTWYTSANIMGLNSYPNGDSVSPQIGDILVSEGTSANVGHIAIVRSVSNNQICTIQQNFSNNANDENRCLSMTIANGNYVVSVFGSSYPITGWLRSPNQLTNGTYLKFTENQDVYYVSKGRLLRITKEQIFYDMGNPDFSNVIEYDSSRFDEITAQYPISNVSMISDNFIAKVPTSSTPEKVYIFSDNKWNWFMTWEAFTSYGHTDDDIVDITQELFNRYPIWGYISSGSGGGTAGNSTPTITDATIYCLPSIPESSSTQCSAVATYDDSSTTNITSSVGWGKDCNYGSINSSGYFTASSVLSDQLCQVKLVYGDISSSFNITIRNTDVVQTPSTSYEFNQVVTAIYVWPNSPNMYAVETDIFIEGDPIYLWLEFNHIRDPVRVQVKFYQPDGKLNTTHDFDWQTSLRMWVNIFDVGINDGCNELLIYREGEWNADIYVDDGSGYKLVNIKKFIIQYDEPGSQWYKDSDDDKYSDGSTVFQCGRPYDYKLLSELTTTSNDCNDNDSSINQGITEICDDGIDNNCNNIIDEGCSVIKDTIAPAPPTNLSVE